MSAPSGADAAHAADERADVVRCPRCGLGVTEGLTFCPRCRAEAEGRAYDPGELDRHERQYVLSLVVVSLGALAIPRLLRSRAFSGGQKAAAASFGVLQTAAVVVIAYWFFGVYFPAYVDELLARGRAR